MTDHKGQAGKPAPKAESRVYMEDTILRMQGIHKWFTGINALHNVDFELKKGEVRALIGENGAGKSTLMKILLGIHQADAGEIEFMGKKVRFREPKDALDAGISMIHQEISLIPTMDVAENVWIGRENKFSKGPFINVKARYQATKDLFEQLGIHVDPGKQVSVLSVAMMQLVELARAVSYNSRLIIMDEPTSALTNEEVELLYSIVRKLTKQGVTVVFISHKIEEIFTICDSVTVLRDGQHVRTCLLNEQIKMEELIQMLVGRDVSHSFVKQETKIGDVVFEAKNFSRKGVFQDVSFQVHAGEIVGFSGLMGAGRSEIARAIFGIDRPDSGQLFMHGKEIRNTEPRKAIRNGLGMVTEDRLRMGAIYTMSVKHNTTIADLFRMTKAGFVKRGEENAEFHRMSEKLSIKYARESDLIKSLSGGNQQKAILGRWMLTKPSFLILDEPTRGIDIGAKMEIYQLMNQLAAQGVAILFISSEMPEILSLCDRTFVVREGRLVHETNRAHTTQEILAEYAFGVSRAKE